jgi:methionyl-tRNA formyltransferase
MKTTCRHGAKETCIKMKIIFMGTPDFAVPCLREIEKRHEVVAVFTQPDRPKGRGYKMVPPPVKEFAEAKGIPVYQPEKLKTPENAEILKNLNPDAIVVVAYGQLLSKEMLETPRLGCINVHGSILPKYRGASPIQWAIVMGEEVTGVSTMRMDEGLDTGDVIDVDEIAITGVMDASMLHDEMMERGASLIVKTLENLENGTATFSAQDDAGSSYAPLLKKDMGRIDWSKSASEIDCTIRGLNPWPVAFTSIGGEYIKIFKAEVLENESYRDKSDGEVVSSAKEGVVVKTADGLISIKELQMSGKKRMDVQSFILGHKIEPGTVLGR